MNVPLRLARKQAKLTQTELAHMLGYKGAQAVSNWETGRINPPLKVAINISNILGIPVNDLFYANQLQESCNDTTCGG